MLVFRKRLLPYSETFIADQARHLERFRATLTGYSLDRSGSHLLEGLECVPLSARTRLPGLAKLLFKRYGRIPAAWLRALRERRPTIVHAHFGPDGLVAAPLARALGVPLVVTFHGFDITIREPLNHYRRRIGTVFASATRVIAVSSYIADCVRERGCPAEKIRRHYIGIDTRRFTERTEPVDEPTVLFVGRLVGKKGCEYLVRAAARLGESLPGLQVQVIGDGPLLEALKALAAELRAPVAFLGRQPPAEVSARISRAAVMCVPSVTEANGNSEGLPMVVPEAMASGVPLVATRHSGIPDAVLDGETGLLVAERDEEGLAEALSRLLQDRGRRGAMGRAAASRARERFDVRKQCRLLEEIYDEAVDAGPVFT